MTRCYDCGMYYQNLNSQWSDFNSIKSDLNRLNSNFVPINLFRIKYDNVINFVSGGSLASLSASFQILLARDATKSYVLLNYTSCLSGSTLIETPGLYYLSSSTGQQMSNQILLKCERNSNGNGHGHGHALSHGNRHVYVDDTDHGNALAHVHVHAHAHAHASGTVTVKVKVQSWSR
jgi:hypothetical protein